MVPLGMSAPATELFAWPGGTLDRRRVTRCALARVCGACEQTLGRPIAFVGTAEEVARNAFHAPPLHPTCVEAVRRHLAGGGGAPLEDVRTSGFEFVRPGRADADPLPRFVPNSLLP